MNDEQDTSGFYRLDSSDLLFWAQNMVSGEGFELHRIDHDSYNYPVDGWYWFDSVEEAKAFFHISDKTEGGAF